MNTDSPQSFSRREFLRDNLSGPQAYKCFACRVQKA